MIRPSRIPTAVVATLLLLTACELPTDPATEAGYVLDQANGIPLPAVLGPADGGSGAARFVLVSSTVRLSRGGRVSWTREIRLEQLGEADGAGRLETRELVGWYAVDGERIEMELITGASGEARTMRISGMLQPRQLVLVIPDGARATRLESYVRRL